MSEDDHDNILELSRFLAASGQHPDDFGRYRFRAQVEIKGDHREAADRLQVTVSMTSSENGKVSLQGNKVINEAWSHLDFHPDFQDFTFDDSDNSLIIEGASAKMGQYVCIITP